MKIEKFNEALKKSYTYYKIYFYVGDQPTGSATRYDTANKAIGALKKYIIDGLPGTDGNFYPITDAYIEKTSKVKEKEIKILFDAKKYNI